MRFGLVAPAALPSPSLPMGGTERVIVSLAVGLSRVGHQVEVFAERSKGDLAEEEHDGILITRFHPSSIERIAAYSPISKVFRGGTLPVGLRSILKTDVFMSFNDIRPLILRGVGMRVLSFHSSSYPVRPSLARHLVQTIRGIDLAICPSLFSANKLKRENPHISRTIVCVYNGIDCELFGHARGDRIRRKVGVGPKDIMLLYCGQISPMKGLDHLLNAMRILTKRNSNATLVVVGSTRLWSQGKDNRLELFEERVRSLALGQSVHFAGAVNNSELPEYFAACDIFICPSIWDEPAPLVNMQAMASGKPVIASRVGGIPEIVRDGETGILVPPASPEAIARGVQALSSEDVRTGMGERGQKLVTSRFDVPHMVDGYLAAIASIER